MNTAKRAFLANLMQVTEAEVAAGEARGRALREQGWVQKSNKYRIIARVPPGMTGAEALKANDPELYQKALRSFEESCREDFLTYCSDKVPGCAMTLGPAEFAGFKAVDAEPDER